MASSLLRIVALTPAALRVTLSGGAVYGSVKYGVWTDSKESREKLERLKNSMEREIQYPQPQATWKSQKVKSMSYSQKGGVSMAKECIASLMHAMVVVINFNARLDYRHDHVLIVILQTTYSLFYSPSAHVKH